MKKFLFTTLFASFALLAFAQDSFIGKWASDKMEQEGDAVTMEFDFKDAQKVQIVVLTEGVIPNTCSFAARFSNKGTYEVADSLLSFTMDPKKASARLQKLKFDPQIEANLTLTDISAAELAFQRELQAGAQKSFEELNNAKFTYFFNETDPDTLIIKSTGEDKDSITLHRKK